MCPMLTTNSLCAGYVWHFGKLNRFSLQMFATLTYLLCVMYVNNEIEQGWTTQSYTGKAWPLDETAGVWCKAKRNVFCGIGESNNGNRG